MSEYRPGDYEEEFPHLLTRRPSSLSDWALIGS